MVASFTISVVTLCSPECVVRQKVFINEQDDAESCAHRWQELHEELISKFGYFVNVWHF